MSGKRSSRGAVSNISTTASPKVPSSNSKKSSILRSSFAPSEFQLALFASVIQGFDSQQLRIHDISTGRLRCDYSVGAAAQINSLDWGYFGSGRQQRQTKKRKRQQANGTDEEFSPEQAVIALGTSESDIRLFSPAEGDVVATLKGGHDRDVKAFKFTKSSYSEGWSIGGDAKLVQWDVKTQRVTRTISLPNSTISILAQPTLQSPQVLYASSIPYAITLAEESSQDIVHFDAFRNPIHSILRSGASGREDNETFLAADSDRYINLYSITEQKLVKTLVAEFGVESLVSSNGSDAVAAITNNGLVQLFDSPFSVPAGLEPSTAARKSKRQGPSRPNATVRLMRPGNSTPTPICNATFDGKNLVVAWVESGVSLAFERIQWQAEGSSSLAFEGTKDIVRGKSSSTLNSVMTNGVHDAGKTFVDDSQAVVTTGGDVLINGEQAASPEEDETGGEDVDDEDEEEEEEEDEAASQLTQEGVDFSAEEGDEEDEEDSDADAEMVDAAPEQDEEEGAETTEPSFGELLASKHPDPITITSALAPTEPSTAPSTLQSGLSLTTVLSQALTTSDNQLLESCLHTTDPSVIRLTIQRLSSNLAASLLSKLADRLSRRPGRYGHLLIWVQWTCVAHGGAIAGRKDVLSKVQSLFKVLNQRAKSLDNLLLLKGKLDMLDAQIGLRKQMMAERRQQQEHSGQTSLNDIDDEDIIYIEGQNEDTSSSDEEEISSTKKPRKSLNDLLLLNDADEEDDEDMPLANGISASEEDDDDGEEDNLIDTEAEEDSSAEGSASEDEDEDDSEEDSEMDSFINDGSISEVDEDEDQDIEEPPPTKLKKTVKGGKAKGKARMS